MSSWLVILWRHRDTRVTVPWHQRAKTPGLEALNLFGTG